MISFAYDEMVSVPLQWNFIERVFFASFCFVRWLFFLRNGAHTETVAAIAFNELLVLFAVKLNIAFLFLIVRLLHECSIQVYANWSVCLLSWLLIDGVYLIVKRTITHNNNFHTMFSSLFNQILFKNFCRVENCLFLVVSTFFSPDPFKR